MFQPIHTDHLTLTPSSLDMERAILEGRDAVERLVSVRIADDWPGKDMIDALRSLIDTYEAHPDWCQWSRNVIERIDGVLIGGVGCIGPPLDDGAVIIGYYIAPGYRRQGYALEAVAAFVVWLEAQPSVRSINAECLKDNKASVRILKRIGMRKTGETVDEEGAKITWAMSATGIPAKI